MSGQKKTNSSGGCSGILYWVFIGWIMWILKWLYIGLYQLAKFIIKQSQTGVEKLVNYTHQRLVESGRDFSLKKVRALVNGGVIIILLTLFGITAALTEGGKQNTMPAISPTFTMQPTFTFTIAPSLTPTKTRIPPTSTPLFGSKAETRCIADDAEIQNATVTRVIDGDTIVVEMEGVEYHLRYIGIDSPESGQVNAATATKVNEELVLGKTVMLIKDVSETDSFGRLLRYVFVGETFVNYQLVIKGAAHSGSWPPDTACDSVFVAAEKTAKINHAGIWQSTPTTAVIFIPTYTPVTNQAGVIPVPVVPQPTSAPVGNCDPSYPTVCIPPPPPDLDCGDITFRRFQVLQPDPHHFDSDKDGIGCESG